VLGSGHVFHEVVIGALARMLAKFRPRPLGCLIPTPKLSKELKLESGEVFASHRTAWALPAEREAPLHPREGVLGFAASNEHLCQGVTVMFRELGCLAERGVGFFCDVVVGSRLEIRRRILRFYYGRQRPEKISLN